MTIFFFEKRYLNRFGGYVILSHEAWPNGQERVYTLSILDSSGTGKHGHYQYVQTALKRLELRWFRAEDQLVLSLYTAIKECGKKTGKIGCSSAI